MRFRPEVLGIVESPLVQIATVAEQMPGALKLCYGESDVPTPEFICRAAYDASVAGHTFYTHTAGCPELREAIAAKIFALHQVSYRPTEIISTVGASMAIFVAIRVCVGPGDNAIVISPAYAIFSNAVVANGGEPRPVPLTFDGQRFRLDIERVQRAIDADTRMIIVNSPSNPTGWVITADEQRALYELAERHELMILADEVYERLAFNASIAPSFATAAASAGAAASADRLVVVNSFSKTYNMTGWRLGWAQGSERMIRLMYSAAEFMTSNAPAMVQQAGIVALRDGESYVRDIREHYAQRRAQVMGALAAVPGITVPAPEGAFYAFPRIAGLTDSTTFTTELVQRTGVALAPGAAFGRDGEGHVRLCFAATEETLAKALSRFRDFMIQRG